MTFSKVGIVGTGQMGLGIAQLLAQAGITTVALKMTGGDTAGKRAQIDKTLQKLVDRQKMTAADKEAAMNNLSFTVSHGDLKDCDLIIESIVEEIGEKQRLFLELDRDCKPETVLASNTSTLCITQLAQCVQRKDRVVGLHFFNPATVMKLVEVIGTVFTPSSLLDDVTAFVTRIGKTPVPVKDETGFIVNRLLTPYMTDAVRTCERRLAGVADIDQAMKLGCNHPMGPLELADYIGLDIVLHMSQNLYETFREERLAPPLLLQRLVLAGQLGRKSGQGFYDYGQNPPAARSL